MLLKSMAVGGFAAFVARWGGASAIAADLEIPERGGAHLPEASADEAWGAQLKMTVDLIASIARQESSSNVAISPASVANVLAVLSTGANRAMHAAICRTLGFTRPVDLRKAVLSRIGRLPARDDAVSFDDANLIVVDPAMRPNSRWLGSFANSDVDVRVEDTTEQSTIDGINAFVQERTRGRVDAILDEPLDEHGLIAVNAVRFDGKWKVAFDPAKTRDAIFHLANGGRSDLPFMTRDGNISAKADDRFVAVELPYAGDDYDLVLLKKNTGNLANADLEAAAGWLRQGGFNAMRCELSMPRFSMSTAMELLPHLDRLGLAKARIDRKALHRISRAPQTLSRVTQRVVLKVDESGTEVAAATAATVTRAVAIKEELIKADFNRPFLFILRDKRVGQIVVAGYIAKLAR